MPREPMAEETIQVALRLPAEYARAADALAKKLSDPGHKRVRADVLRQAIHIGLGELARECRRPGKR